MSALYKMPSHVYALGKLFLLLFILSGCAADRPFYAQKPAIEKPPSDRLLYSVFLVGDTGDVGPDSLNATLQVLQKKLHPAGERSAVVFLGDNLYPHGLPTAEADNRKALEERLITQLKMLADYSGRIVFIPGNHDWASSGKDGLAAVQRMEEFIESYLNRGNTFLPDAGFPGPTDIKLMDKDDDPLLTRDIHLLVLDTQWWLHPYEKSFGDTGEYDLHDSGDFLNELTDVMRNRRNDHVVMAGHHPLFSNGTHGGSFPLKRHLLPPIGGSAYVLYRKFIGFPQDIPHFRYQSLRRELLRSFRQLESLVYAAGHEHALQHNVIEEGRYSQHHIVSGSGSRTDYVAKGKGASFVSGDHGFAVINYYADRSSWLEFWNDKDELLYRRQLLEPRDNPLIDSNDRAQKEIPSLEDSTATVAANPKYDKAGWLHQALLGAHNRHLWSIPVEAPLFNIADVRGGLQPVKIGGTGQSTTLRLEDDTGRTFVLRSIDKEAGRIWDTTLRNTVANDLVQDQFSVINPYGALMIPPLAEAVSVYHTNPELYVIPDDPRLGRYADLMSGELALFEERPDDDMSHAPHLSGSAEVLSTRDMFRKVDSDIDHRVDQQMMLRNRLLDLLISDWDRHEDQWRWASFEPEDKKGKIYQPIPRDRDMAFHLMNGILPAVAKLSVFEDYQGFRSSYGNIKGLTKNSLPMTRRFTNQLTKDDWKAIADSITQVLTDDVLEEAASRLPSEITKTEKSKIERILIQRRDKLPEIALEYYHLLAKVSDVVGSHKREKFVVESYSGDSVRVQVRKLKKDGKIGEKYFNRTFYADETNELRLYGLGGDDVFEVLGLASDAITIRIIGGAGSDEFIRAENAKGKVHIYDNANTSTLRNLNSFKITSSERPDINHYEYGFKYNRTDPLLYFGSNRDDGLFVGGGAQIARYGFRKEAIHRIRGNFAAQTQALNIRYDGYFANLTGDWDGKLNIDVLLPNNIRNFYGLGNETDDNIPRDDFYQARLWQYRVKSALQRSVATGISFSAGPYFQVTKVREDEGRFVGQPQVGISENTFEDQWFAGLQSNLLLASVDNEINPRQGFRWKNQFALNLGVENTSKTYSSLGSSLAMYWSPVYNPQLTFATRIGIDHHLGSFPFYEANTLGGKNTLRGLRSNRYAGRTSFINNIEARTKLLDFQNYLFGGEMGLFGFVDHGRVWTDGEDSKYWHYGSGGGFWMSLFNMTVVRGSVGFSEGSYNMLIGAGFFF